MSLVKGRGITNLDNLLRILEMKEWRVASKKGKVPRQELTLLVFLLAFGRGVLFSLLPEAKMLLTAETGYNGTAEI